MIVFICGPTASGKSRLALSLAQTMKSVIINADSAQVYRDLQILTASPTDNEKKEVSHLLYNFLNLNEDFCLARYLNVAVSEIKNVIADGMVPIVVGGSGLYISSLISGIHDIPYVTKEVRNYLQIKIEGEGLKSLYDQLARLDPIFASQISSNDSYRIARGYGVFIQSGRVFSSFLNSSRINPLKEHVKKIIFLSPKKDLLHQLIASRLVEMMERGAIKEISNLQNLDYCSLYRAKRVIGVSELLDYVCGKNTYIESISAIEVRSRQYAKRQMTWFKNQVMDKQEICYSDLNELRSLIDNISHLHNGIVTKDAKKF